MHVVLERPCAITLQLPDFCHNMVYFFSLLPKDIYDTDWVRLKLEKLELRGWDVTG